MAISITINGKSLKEVVKFKSKEEKQEVKVSLKDRMETFKNKFKKVDPVTAVLNNKEIIEKRRQNAIKEIEVNSNRLTEIMNETSGLAKTLLAQNTKRKKETRDLIKALEMEGILLLERQEELLTRI